MSSVKSGRAYSRPGNVYNFKQQLAVEAETQQYMDLLFMPHSVVDMTQDKREQKNGNDFFLYPLNDTDPTPIRVENKFETKTSGNFALELVSYDRPKLAPGWMFTSKCATLMSWFPTGEVCVWQMSELRKWCYELIEELNSTTTMNPSYLSWNVLPKLEDALIAMPNSRVIDLGYELGFQNKSDKASLITAKTKELRMCTVQELVAHLQSMPRESRPKPVQEAQVHRCMQLIEKRNFMRRNKSHLAMIDSLPKAFGLQGSGVHAHA